MAEPSIQRPRTDDRLLWEPIFGLYGYPAVLLAHKLKLFSFLENRPRTLSEICNELGIKRRPATAIVTAAVSLGFLKLQDGSYSLTAVAEDYLLERSATYFGACWDLIINNYDLCSFGSIEKAALTDTAQAYGATQEMFKSHEQQAELARSFTRAMHSTSMGPALAWPDLVDLSNSMIMLDIGGGSGAHSIGAALKYSQLQAIVFDAAPVCEVANEFVIQHALSERITTHVGDMWKDSFPPADVHFYSFIYHDWTPEKCRLLTQRSFESLPSGGRILIHEMLYNDEKTGPFPVAAMSMIMLGWTEGEQYSARDLSTMLTEAGFTNVEKIPTIGYWSIVSGRKH